MGKVITKYLFFATVMIPNFVTKTNRSLSQYKITDIPNLRNGTEQFRNLLIPNLRNGTECSVICSYLNYGTELTELAYFYQI